MSLISLAKYSVAAKASAAIRPVKMMTLAEMPDLGTRGAAPAGETEAKKQEYADKVVQHIPSEAVGFYIFAAGLFQDATAPTGWGWTDGRVLIFFLTLVLTLTLAWYLTGKRLEGEKTASPFRPRREHVWKMFAAALAFVAWAGAMPGSVFAGFGWYDARLAAVALALVALILPKLSDAVLRKG